MSTYSQLHVVLTFIRKNSAADASNDDRLTIRKNLDTNDFEIIYRDANEGLGLCQKGAVIHKLSGMYRERVLEHVYLLLKNQYLDTDGFAEIQLDMPAMPRVLLKAESMYDLYYRDHIYELVGAALDNLENGERIVPAQAQPKQTHLNTQFYEPQTPVDYQASHARTPRPVRRSPRIASSGEFTGHGQHLFFDE